MSDPRAYRRRPKVAGDWNCFECGAFSPDGFCENKHPEFSLLRAIVAGNVQMAPMSRHRAPRPPLTCLHCGASITGRYRRPGRRGEARILRNAPRVAVAHQRAEREQEGELIYAIPVAPRSTRLKCPADLPETWPASTIQPGSGLLLVRAQVQQITRAASQNKRAPDPEVPWRDRSVGQYRGGVLSMQSVARLGSDMDEGLSSK